MFLKIKLSKHYKQTKKKVEISSNCEDPQPLSSTFLAFAKTVRKDFGCVVHCAI